MRAARGGGQASPLKREAWENAGIASAVQESEMMAVPRQNSYAEKLR